MTFNFLQFQLLLFTQLQWQYNDADLNEMNPTK